MKKMIYRHGVEKVLFASDCPWDSSKNSLEALRRLKLTSSEEEKILSKNGLELLDNFK
jgi:predicted TIM-barrel fold metal-dependent hydrolase